MKRLRDILFLLLLPSLLFGQQCSDYYFHNLTTVDGLSQNSVSFIVQDRQGFVWLATQTGIDKYVGASFIPISSFNKSLFEQITYLYDWDENYLLVSSNQKNILVHKWAPGKKRELNGSLTGIIHIEKINHGYGKGTLLAFTDKAIAMVDGELKLKNSFWTAASEKEKNNRVIHSKRSNEYFLGREKGLWRFDMKQGAKSKPEPIKDSAKAVEALCFNKDTSALYYGGASSNFIYRYHLHRQDNNIDSLNFVEEGKSRNVSVSSMHIENDNTLWIGTKNSGLYLRRWEGERWKSCCRFNSSCSKYNTAYFSSNHINCIYSSKDGVVWVGVNEGGLNVWQSDKPVFKHTMVSESDYAADSLYRSNVWSVYADSSGKFLLVGLKEGGIALIDRTRGIAQKRLKSYNAKGDDVLVINRHGDEVYIGTADSIIYTANWADLEQMKFYSALQVKGNKVWAGKRVTHLEFSQATEKWVVGNRGDSTNIYIFDHTFDQKIPIPMKGKGHFSFAKTVGEYAVVGTSTGLYRLDLLKNALDTNFFKLKEKDTIPIHFTCAVKVDNTIWAGSDRRGLFSFSAINGKEIGRATMPEEVIYDLQKDVVGNLWFSTNHGIYRFNPDIESFNRYGIRDGLRVYEYNSGSTANDSSSGELFFGGINGLNFFKPAGRKLLDTIDFLPVLQCVYGSNAPDIIDFNQVTPDRAYLLPYKFGYLDIMPMLGHYQDPGSNGFILTLNGKNLSPREDGHYIISESQLSSSLYFWKKNKLTLSYRGGNSGWIDAETFEIKRAFFSGTNFLIILLIVLLGAILLGLNRAYRNRKKLQILHEKINEVSQLVLIEEICNKALEHLTNDLRFEYAIISLIDFNKKNIQIQYIKDDLLSADEIALWKERSQYPLTHNDILAQVANVGEYVVVAGNKLISNPKIKQTEDLFNEKVAGPLAHQKVARVFVPLVHRGSQPSGASGRRIEETVLGVVEVGFRMNWLNERFLPLSNSIHALDFRGFNIFGFLKNRQIRLKLYVDNLAQPYYKSYVKEKKIETYAFVEYLANESSEQGMTYRGFLQFALAKMAQRINVDYGNVPLTQFNDEGISPLNNERVYGYSLEDAIIYEKKIATKNEGKEGIINHVARTKSFYYSGDVSRDDKYLEFIPDVQSELALPMAVNEGAPLIGVFNLMSKKKSFFNQVLAAIYLKGAKKITEIYLQKKQYETLQKISAPTDNFSLSEDVLYSSMTLALQEYFHSDYVSVWVRKTHNEPVFALSPSATIPEFYKDYVTLNFIEARINEDPDDNKPEKLVKVVKTSDIKNKKSRLYDLCKKLDFKGYIALKIVTDNKYQAFINVFSKREIHEDEVKGYSGALLNEVAKKVALATMNIRLMNAIEAISGSLVRREAENPLNAIVNQAWHLAPSADSVVLFPYREDEQILIGHAIVGGTPFPSEDASTPLRRANLANYVIENGTQYIDSDKKFEHIAYVTDKDRPINSTFWKKRNIKSVAAIRLEFGGRPVGVMIFNYLKIKHFDGIEDDAQQFIKAFTNFATTALLNEDYIRRIQEARVKISEELNVLGERQNALKREAVNLKKEKDEIQTHSDEVQQMLEEILPRAAGASFFLILQGINHDIRTLLLEMQADLDEFKDDLPDKHRDQVEVLSRQVEENALKITNLLKLFNPSEQNIKEAVLISEVIEQVLLFFKKNQPSRIKFKTDFNVHLPDLICHKAEFSMVIYNLVKNAIQAIPQSRAGEITVSAHFKNKHFVLTVQDNGEGIDNDLLHKIFDLRYTTKPSGIGVGLYFVKETIENKLEGRIWATSQKGKGSIFHIEIPEYINYKR